MAITQNNAKSSGRQKYTLDEIIVISPGTSDFKIGMASIKNPIQVPAIFAIRQDNPLDTNLHENKFSDILPSPKFHSDYRENRIKKILKSQVYSNYVDIPTEEQFKNEEKYGVNDSLETITNQERLEVEQTKKFLYGSNALNLKESSPYKTVPIFKNGVLNLEFTPAIVFKDIIRDYLIESLNLDALKIGREQFKNFCVAFVVPVSFCKAELKFFVDIFLKEMKFKALFIHLEPVVACFGTGFSGACVVDIGHESTKVACVQNGSIVLKSKIVLPYGGKNITELCLYSLLSKKINEFYCPLGRDININEIKAKSLVENAENLKRNICCYTKETRPVKNYVGDISLTSGKSYKIKITLSNVAVISPLGLFYPKMFRPLKNTEKSYKVHNVDSCQFEYEKNLLDSRSDVGDSYIQGMRNMQKTKFRSIDLGSAIVDSILSLTKAEDRMTMATSILLVGGSVKIKGISEAIEQRVKELLQKRNSTITHVEKLPRRDEKESGMSPEFCSWLGMSIICANEGCREMWVTPTEWEKNGTVHLLRTKVPFEMEMEISNEIK